MKKLAVLFALLAAAALAWWAWSSEPEVTTTDSTSTPVPAPSPNAASAAVAAPAEPIADASTQRTSAPQTIAAEPPGPESILRGRCVDAAGKPIAGVEATIHGFRANQGRMAAWTKEHDEPESTTAKDVMLDFLHLTEAAYRTWAEAIVADVDVLRRSTR